MALIVGGATVTSGANLDASKLTGTASAINGSNITSLPAPSSANVASAVAQAQANAVGSYGCYKHKTNGDFSANAGDTVSGSALYPAATGGEPQFSSPSGTFRLMGRVNGNDSQGTRRTSVWLRIS